MGCCFSINTPISKQNQNGLKSHQPNFRSTSPKSNAITHELNHKAPPPVEEESVKEVLSETPISKPQASILIAETKTQLPQFQYTKEPIFHKAEEQVSEEEVSQVTETRSISEGFSTTTTVMVERGDEATSKRSFREETQNRYRSQSERSSAVDGIRIGGIERRPKSPARYPPEKRIPAISQSVRRRESGHVRRGPDDGSGRRLRSPSAGRRFSAGNSRSQVKPPGIGGQRLTPVNGVRERYVEENGVVAHEESLENPHVSLECFIFL